MPGYHDGPSSPLFHALPIQPHAQQTPGVCSPALLAALQHDAPSGSCTGWGIPFEIEHLWVSSEPLSLDFAPFRARWLVFMHTSDLVPTRVGSSNLVPPRPFTGHDADLAAIYRLGYANGAIQDIPIRRNFHLNAFTREWGYPVYQAVAHHKPHPIHAHHEQMIAGWGRSQTRLNPRDYEPFECWLYAWENPSPAEPITHLDLLPGNGAIVLFALSYGDSTEHPFRWSTRRKAIFQFPPGLAFNPTLDPSGVHSQIQIDLGQVISVTPRPLYPNQEWELTFDNQLPLISESELLIEYSAHPDARIHLPDGSVQPIADFEAGMAESARPITPASQRVTLRVVDKASRKPLAVKLHVHGAAGEYLPPLDRHRIPNPAWFEDYSVDFTHLNRHHCTYIDGLTRLDLPLGPVYVEVSKGFEIRPLRRVFEITPETTELTVEIEKSLPWRQKGWVTADTHVHFLSPVSALLEGAGEGVNVVNLLASQWGELMTNVGDFDGKTTWGALDTGGGPEGDGEYLVRVGTENRQHALGHISLLGYRGPIIAPMTCAGPEESAIGDPVESLLTEWARQCKAQDGVVVLPHFSRPHLEQAAVILNGAADAVEMTCWENHYLGIDPYSLVDWYRYLSCGYKTAAVGGTDKMDAMTQVGTVRTYARLDPSQPFTYDHWKTALRRGETFVTYGPLIEFMVAGRPMGSEIHLPSGGGTLDVHWQVASLTLPASRVELIVDGEVRESQPIPPEGASGSWSVRVAKSSWLALLVRGHQPGLLEIIAAHSSPVMVRVAGSEFLNQLDAASILTQIEGALAYLDTLGTYAEAEAYRRMRLVLTATHRRLHNRLHAHGMMHDHTPGEEHHG